MSKGGGDNVLRRCRRRRMPSPRKGAVLGKGAVKGQRRETFLDVGEPTVIPSLDDVFGPEDRLAFLARNCRRAPVDVFASIRRAARQDPRFRKLESSIPGSPSGEVSCENFVYSVTVSPVPRGPYFLDLVVRDSSRGRRSGDTHFNG